MLKVNQLKLALVAPALCALFVASGCGSLNKLAAQANATTPGAEPAADASGSSSGGSLALTEPSTVSPDAKTIRVEVRDEAACFADGQDGRDEHDGKGRHGHGGKKDRRPPPRDGHGPRPDGKGRGPWPSDQGDNDGDDQDANLTDAASTSSGDPTDSTDSAASDAASNDAKDDGAPSAGMCVVGQIEEDFDSGKALSLDNLPVGKYTVQVLILDKDGKGLEQGSADIEIVAGETAAADIMLAPTPEGSVSVTVHEAVATDPATSGDATATP